ncbi:MAG: SRPBCC family protein [Bacteroidales bacterium]|nr:SRPBCC family protein [Bacteroidales bacterium]MCF8337995.1 SRPBCC family protein [Bacteroidales bacterium]
MKALRITVIIIAILLVTLLILGALFPSEHHIEQRVAVDASPEKIYKQINTLKNWENWAPSSPDFSYSGPESGEGARQSWVNKNGKGYLEITRSRPYTLIRAEMKYPGDKKFKTNWLLRPQKDSTYVIWGMDYGGLSYPFGRLRGLIINGRMQANIHQGLHNLKAYMEKKK